MAFRMREDPCTARDTGHRGCGIHVCGIMPSSADRPASREVGEAAIRLMGPRQERSIVNGRDIVLPKKVPSAFESSMEHQW